LGGFDGGMTTGMPIVIKGVMKPIPTLYEPSYSVDLETKAPFAASIERSESYTVPAADAVLQHVVPLEIEKSINDQIQKDQFQESSAYYPIYIGKHIRSQFDQLLPKSYSAILIISDEQVAPLYADDLIEQLSNRKVYVEVISAGEASKNIHTYYDLQTKA